MVVAFYSESVAFAVVVQTAGACEVGASFTLFEHVSDIVRKAGKGGKKRIYLPP